MVSQATRNVSCFSWIDRFHLFISEKKSAKYPSLNIQFVCQLFFQEAVMFHEKVASLACYSNNCTSVFPQENHSVLGCNKSPFCELPILSYRTQKTCTQRLRVNKLKTLIASPWVKLAFFFKKGCECMWGRNMIYSTVWCWWLHSGCASSFIHCFFCTIWANVNTMNVNTILVLL